MRFNTLPQNVRDGILKNLEIRRARFVHFVIEGKEASEEFPAPEVVIVGDRPGPSAPKEPDYHHTPFYSVKHCSGWLNELLWEWKIDERRMLWLNAFDKDGVPTPDELLVKIEPPQGPSSFPTIIALGGNAERWMKKNGWTIFIKAFHPQYHKRFRNKERYDLPLLINDCLEMTTA
jgi:hypothetical protein